MNTEELKEVINEAEEYVAFQKYLKDFKGADYTIEECYNMVQWFKNSNNIKTVLNPTQGVLFFFGHREAMFFMGEQDQMNKIYELYYALKHGIIPLGDKLQI